MTEALDNLKTVLTGTHPRAPDTLVTYLSIANQFLTWLGDRTPPTALDIHRYFAHRREQGMKETSLQTHFAVLQKLFEANRWTWPLTASDRPQGTSEEEARELLEDEVVQLIQNHERYSKAECFYLAIATTFFLRRIELARIKKGYIKENTIFIDTAKKGEKGWHLIPDEIMPYIRAYKVHEHNVSGLSAMFDRICVKGLGKHMPGYGWHSFRYCGDTVLPTYLARAGKPLTLVGLFLRWSRKEIGRKILGASMAGVYTRQRVMSSDPYWVDREVFECHPFLRYWQAGEGKQAPIDALAAPAIAETSSK